MLIADIPTTRVAVKVIKRVLPVRPLLCQYQRRVSCTALLCNWPPCVPYDHPTIFSLNKCIYNTHTHTHRHRFTNMFLATKTNSTKAKLLPGMCRVWWTWEFPKDKDMEKKKKREKERSKTDGFDLKHDIMAWIVSRLTFPQAKYLQRERERERVCVSVCVFIWVLLVWHTEFTVLGPRLIVAFWRKYPCVLLWRWRYSLNLFSFFFWK